MKTFSKLSMWMAVTALVMGVVATASAQTFKMTTPIAPGVAVPDKIERFSGSNLHYSLCPNASTASSNRS